MWTAFTIAWRDHAIRIAMITLMCVGFTYASTVPYYSLVGVNQLGMQPGHYAILSAAAALAGMFGSVFMGFMADRSPNRKLGVMISLSVGLLGFGGFYFYPSIITFALFLLMINPMSGAAYTQLFAIIRSISKDRPAIEATQINSVVRAVYALSWIVVPGLVGAYIAISKDVTDGFAIAALAFLLCIALFGIWGLPGSKNEPSKLSAWQGLKEALGLVASKRIAPRLLALAMIASVQPANMQLLPLMITTMESGSTRDIGLIAGLTAGLEIPFMLLVGYFASRMPIWKIILAGGLIFALYIGLAGFAKTVPQLYGLTLLNALGNAIMLTMHLTYCQECLPDRPGLGTSLLSIGGVLCKFMSAGIFALAGTALGFSGAAMVASAVALAGCVLLLTLDNKATTAR